MTVPIYFLVCGLGSVRGFSFLFGKNKIKADIMEKIYTIKSNALFSKMYRAKNSPQPTVVLYYRKNPSLKKAQIGITTGKKLGGAVERNRARRIIREAYRALVLEGTGINDEPYNFVFVARHRCFLKETRMQDVLCDMRRAFHETGILKK